MAININSFSGQIDPTKDREEELLRHLGLSPMVKTDTVLRGRTLRQQIQEEQIKNLVEDKPITPLRRTQPEIPESTQPIKTEEIKKDIGVQQTPVGKEFFEDYTQEDMPDAVALGLVSELEWRHAGESRRKQLQQFLDAPHPSMPFISNYNAIRNGGNVVSGALRTAEGIAGAVEWLSQGDPATSVYFNKIGNTISDWAYGFEPRDKRSFMDDVFSGFGSMAMFMAPAGVVSGSLTALGLGTKLATGLGMTTMTTLEAMTEAGQIYRETGDNDASTKSFLANIVLIGLTNKFGLGSAQKNLLKKAILSATNEGIQEGGQEIISALSKGEAINWDNVIRSVGVGAVVGGGVSTVTPSDVANVVEGRGTIDVGDVGIDKLTDPATIDDIVTQTIKNGGSTTSPQGKVTSGYVVGTQKGSGKVIDGRRVTPKDIEEFLEANKNLLRVPNTSLGTWYDKDNNKVHLDIVKTVPTESEAMKIARQNEQIAIYNLDTQEEIKTRPPTTQERLVEQREIPKDRRVKVYHYSPVEENAFTTDPSKFGEQPHSRRAKIDSPEPRTYFYTSPEQVQDDVQTLRDMNMFEGYVDATKIYDFTQDPEGLLTNEYGIQSVDTGLMRAREKGYDGIKYKDKSGKDVIATFKPIALERPNAPSLSNILSDKWNGAVGDAKDRINKGHYGTTSLGANPFVGGFSLIQDLAVISLDYMMKTKTPLGRPADFVKTMVDIFGEQAEAWRKYAREIYEMVKSMRGEFDKTGLDYEQLEGIKETINKNLSEGTYPEFSATNQGVIIIGGDALDYEGGRKKAVGTRFPEDQATKAGRRQPSQIFDSMMQDDSIPFPQKTITNGYGEIDFIEGDGDIMIMVSTVADEMTQNPDVLQMYKDRGLKLVPKGQGYGTELYEDLIDYARQKGKTLSSDTTLSKYSFGTWRKLARKYPSVVQEVPDSELNVFVDGNLKQGLDPLKDKFTTVGSGGKSIFRYYPETDTGETVKAGRRRGKTYPIWATNKVVARQIEKEALKGNDTIVFMQYPNVWDAVKVNYDFQSQLHDEVMNEVVNNNLDISVPELPPLEVWSPETGITGVDTEALREEYYKKIQKALREIKKTKKGKDAQKHWTQDSMGLKFARENSINLSGKIFAVAKFDRLNFGQDRIDPHKLYDTEIEGYNFRNLPEPIAFSMFQEETKGGDVGIRGEEMMKKKGEERETDRRRQMYREMRQRGLVVNRGQSDLTDSLIQFANGDDNYFYEWLDRNPEWKDHIVDWEAHKQWNMKREDIDKQHALRVEAELKKLLPNYFGMGINPMQMLKSLSVWGKAIARGTKNFGQWAGKMLENFGEWVRPLLRDIWSRITQMPNIFAKVPKNVADDARKLQNQVVKEEIKEENVNKKKDKTYSWNYQDSITKGYNEELEHPKLAPHIARMAESVRKEFDLRRRGTISNEDLIRIAKDKASYLTDADILELNVGDIVNAEDVLAMRIYVTNEALKISDEIAKFGLDATDPTSIANMSSEFSRVIKMWMAVRAIGTEMGRGVQSFSIPMEDGIVDAMRVLTQKLNELDPEGRYGGDIVANALDEMAGTPTEETEKKTTAWEKARFVFLNFILSNPFTDMANIFGNTSNLGFHITANIGNLGGAKTLLKGIKNGFREGLRDAVKVLHGEQEAISKFTEGSQVDVPTAEGRKARNWFKLLVPTTRLGMEDAFFRALVRNVELERMTTKLSSKFGVQPTEIYQSVHTILADPELGKMEPKYVREMVDYLEAIEDELVFQKELGKVGKGFAQISKVAFPILPFVTTPANILKFGLSATPLGLAKLIGKENITTEQKNQIIRRAVAGSLFMSGLGAMVAQGLMEITGGGSEDPYERDLMAKLGYKPYHLYINTPYGKFGGSYQNVNPLNVPFTIVGDLMDKYRFKKAEEKVDDKEWYDKAFGDVNTALLGVAGSITDQSFLTGMRDFVDWLNGRKPDWGMRMLTNFGRVGLVSGIQKITGTEDRGQYDVRGRMMEQFQKNLPISNKGLVPSVSAFGEQRQSQYERFPIPISERKPEPQYEWLAHNNLEVPIPSKGTKLGNREMTRKEYALFSMYVGKAMDNLVKQMYEKYNDPELEEKPSLEEIQDKIEAGYRTATKKAKEKIIEKIIKQQQLKEEE